MPKLVIWSRFGTEERVDSQIEVADLHEATMALGNDLIKTADPAWAAEVMEKWEADPGKLSVPDKGGFTWNFEYMED